MPRKHETHSRERLKPIDSDDETQIYSTERKGLCRNKALPERRSMQLPPLFPPVSRDMGSENDIRCKQYHHQISDDTKFRLPPLSNAAMGNMVSHYETATPDLQHLNALQNHQIDEPKRNKRHKKKKNVPDGDVESGAQIDNNVNECLTSTRLRVYRTCDELYSARRRDESHRDEFSKIQEHIREKANVIHPDGATYNEGCNKSQYDQKTKRCTKKKRSQWQHNRNKTSDIKRKQCRLEPLDMLLHARKQHTCTQLDNSIPLPSIKHEEIAKNKIEQNECGVDEISHTETCTGKENVEKEHKDHIKENHKDNTNSVFGLCKYISEDDKELKKELRLDLSFLYPKKKAKKPCADKVMDISLRDSDPESGENEHLKAGIDSVNQHGHVDENKSLCLTEVDDSFTDTPDSDDLDEDLFEDDDIPIMTSGSPIPERCFLLKPR